MANIKYYVYNTVDEFIIESIRIKYIKI